MIEILVAIVVFLVIFYIVKLIIGQLGLPGPIVQIIYIVMALIAFLWLLDLVGLYSFNLRRV